MMPHMNIAFCCSVGYLKHACAAISSVLMHNPAREMTIYIVSPPLQTQHVQSFDKLRAIFGADIRHIEMDPSRVAHLGESKFVERESYYRMFLAKLLPNVGKVLCLDADLIVTASLAPLWNTDIDELALAGVPTQPSPEFDLRLGIGDDPYVNAGVLLLNLDFWRAHDYLDRMIHWLETTDPNKVLHMDQDAINVVAKGHKRLVDWRWNFNPVMPEKYLHGEDFVQSGYTGVPSGILHFYGPIKPWHKWFDLDFQALYQRQLEFSPWKDDMPAEPWNLGQSVLLANQYVRKGQQRDACVYYQRAIELRVKAEGLQSTLELDTINFGHQKFNGQDYSGAIQHYQSLVKHWGLPTQYKNQTSVYGVRGAMDIKPPLV